MKPRNPPFQPLRLLDQVREQIRYRHYILSTEKNLPLLGPVFRTLAWPQRANDASARHGGQAG